jgi:hypothetical protein
MLTNNVEKCLVWLFTCSSCCLCLSWLLSLNWQEAVVTLVAAVPSYNVPFRKLVQKLDWELMYVCYSVGCRA